jgi:hypothetical protein
MLRAMQEPVAITVVEEYSSICKTYDGKLRRVNQSPNSFESTCLSPGIDVYIQWPAYVLKINQRSMKGHEMAFKEH